MPAISTQSLSPSPLHLWLRYTAALTDTSWLLNGEREREEEAHGHIKQSHRETKKSNGIAKYSLISGKVIQSEEK